MRSRSILQKYKYKKMHKEDQFQIHFKPKKRSNQKLYHLQKKLLKKFPKPGRKENLRRLSQK